MLNTLNRFADARKLEAGGADAGLVRDFRRGAAVLKELAQLLGVFREPASTPAGNGNHKLVGDLVELLIQLRAEARKGKNFALADQIRQRLAGIGVTLEDRPGGTTWRLG